MSARERKGAREAGSKGPGDSGVVREKAYEHIAAIRTPLINILASARPVSLFLRGWQSRDRLLLWLVVISCGQSVDIQWARSANYRQTLVTYRKLSETIGNYRKLSETIGIYRTISRHLLYKCIRVQYMSFVLHTLNICVRLSVNRQTIGTYRPARGTIGNPYDIINKYRKLSDTIDNCSLC